MTDTEQKLAARQFAADWAGHGDEKQETQSFWLALLRTVYGVAEPERYINFEMPVRVKTKYKGKITTKFIDAYIPSTKVLIEQKSCNVNLFREERQSSGQMFTAFDQAQNYANHLPLSIKPRWIITCNFQEFYIYNAEQPNDEPIRVALDDLASEYHQLDILVNREEDIIRTERVSEDAGTIVRKLYEALKDQYDPADPKALESLNTLCVRLVFCFFADSAGIFEKNQFRNYLARRRSSARQALIDLFEVLDTNENRNPYWDEDLLAFPYVNGGLFSKKQDISIPRIPGEIVDLILHQAYNGFKWSEINPPVFGSIFESTLNPETRHDLGMHYTTVRNIHKVIDPLFLDELKQEFFQIVSIPVPQTRRKRLIAFQNKLASLKFLDPSCGSGNFLTETYLSLRKLENEVIGELQRNQSVLGDIQNPVKVSISQFYGIEINNFAVSVAKAALWIAESQMLQQTEAIVRHDLDFLPLKTNAHIVEGNALRLDWESVVAKDQLHYIMGNPPFVGARMMTQAQKDNLNSVFPDWKNAGNLDYVSCWYKKAADMMAGTAIRAALVSTNSITQGEQVPILWKGLINAGIHIDFAYRTFRWDSEAKSKAHVHCVIIGFSAAQNEKAKLLFFTEQAKIVDHINPYLVDGPDVLIESRKKPLYPVPPVVFGSMPNDGGHLSDFSSEEKDAIIAKYPDAAGLFKRFVGATEFLHGKERWCLWLKGVSPARIRRIPPVLDSIMAVKQMRESSDREATRKLADTPTLFGEIRQPSSPYIIIPCHSSQARQYIPLGFEDADTICGNANLLMANANLYHFGVLMSDIHNMWMRVVCGRIKSDYRYSVNVVYNNFPWPEPTEAQRAKIQLTARGILDARALYPDASLADLYDAGSLLPELRKAHRANDKAVWEAYGGAWPIGSESACVAWLMKLYQAKAT